jgi:hypothetical protein
VRNSFQLSAFSGQHKEKAISYQLSAVSLKDERLK